MLAESIRDILFWVHVVIVTLGGGGVHGDVLSVLVPFNFNDCLGSLAAQGERCPTPGAVEKVGRPRLSPGTHRLTVFDRASAQCWPYLVKSRLISESNSLLKFSTHSSISE